MKRFKICRPNEAQLRHCFELEQFYSSQRPDAEKIGFFLSGVSFDLYKNLSLMDGVWCIPDSEETVAAYVAIAPPNSKIVENILSNKQSLVLFNNEDLLSDKVCWIAKIASKPEFRNCGNASELYNHIFELYKDCICLTATAISPLRNKPSENFQRKMGMEVCGVYLGAKKDAVDTPVSLVWMKRPI